MKWIQWTFNLKYSQCISRINIIGGTVYTLSLMLSSQTAQDNYYICVLLLMPSYKDVDTYNAT